MRRLAPLLVAALLAGCASAPAPPPATGHDFTQSFDVAEGTTPVGWDVTGGAWAIADNATAHSAPHVFVQAQRRVGSVSYILATSAGSFGDAQVGTYVRAVDGLAAAGGGIVFRFSDPSNFYVALLDTHEGKVRFVEFSRAQRTEQTAAIPYVLPPGTWVHLVVEARGDAMTIFLDGAAALAVHDPTLRVGHVGLWTQDDAVTQFDDVSAKKL